MTKEEADAKGPNPNIPPEWPEGFPEKDKKKPRKTGKAGYVEPGPGGATDWVLYHARDGSNCAYSPQMGVWCFIDGSTSFDWADYPDISITGFARLAQALNNAWRFITPLSKYPSGNVRGTSSSGIRG